MLLIVPCLVLGYTGVMPWRFDGLETFLYDGEIAPPTHGELIGFVPEVTDDVLIGMSCGVPTAGVRAYLDDTDPLDRAIAAEDGYDAVNVLRKYLQPNPRGLGQIAANGCRILLQSHSYGPLLVVTDSIYEVSPRRSTTPQEQDHVQRGVSSLLSDNWLNRRGQ